MKLNFTALLAAVAMSSALIANAVPAKRDKQVVKQPDGTYITIYQVGDEHNHFTLTEDNKLLVQEDNGQFSYAKIDNDGLITSTLIKAVDLANRPASHAAIAQSFDELNVAKIVEAKEIRKNRKKASAIAQSGIGTFSSFPKKGDIKGLVILVEFQDVDFNTSYSTNALQYFTDMMNKRGFDEYGGTGCAEEYFIEQSNNQFRPEFTVVGPYKVAHNMSYYGANDSYGNDTNAEGMIVEACQLADDDVNFADFDNDGDGVCDNVFVFYAGKGEATSGIANTIWPHSYNLKYTNKTFSLDGVTIDRYACTNEWVSSRPDGVGTFIHEFSHVMGLPDLYNTTTTSYYTPCSYSVLDYGPYNNNGCTPPAYSVFERNAMEWIDLKVLDGPESISLGHIADSNEACIAQTSSTNEFFLFENRQLSGWDKYIPGHGMIIWHIDYQQTKWTNNVVNNSSSHQCVDLVEANNQTNSSSMSKVIMKGWTWPGTSSKTEFTAETTPAFKDWNGNAIELPITNIEENDGIITFDVCGGSPSEVPEPLGDDEVEKGEDYFVASWTPCNDATDYKLWVYAVIDTDKNSAPRRRSVAADDESETATMGNGTTAVLPDGWTSSGLGTYVSTSSCGESTPSAKLSATGSFIQTCYYEKHQVTGIKFWMKGAGTTSGSSLKVLGMIDDKWTELGAFIPENGTGNTYTVQDIPEHVKQVRFEYTKDKGNVAIDDIVISLQGSKYDQVLPDYNGILTGGETSVRIDKLIDGCTTYKYKVASTPDGELFSKVSDVVTINLVDNSGVNNIVSSFSNEQSIAINDRTITVSTDADRVEVYNTLGRHIASVRVSDGSAMLSLPTAGMYIVRTGNTSAKVVVR